MSGKISERFKVTQPFTEADIGGTNTAGSDDTLQWVDCRGAKRVTVIFEIGTWNATDDLDTCKIEQAQDAIGTGKKDLTTSGAGAGYDYNASAPVDADGDRVIFDIDVAKLDVANGFCFIRPYAAETGNTGVDNVSCLAIVETQEQRDQLNGAPVAGSLKYIVPGLGAAGVGV
jgi:hypothetical protein